MYPMQLSFQRFQADEQGWVDTIKSVRFGGAVRISTMDWLGQSQYLRQTVFWPSLSSAVSELLKQVIFSKHALVNMLVTYWSHFLDGTDEYLKSILYSTILCHSSSRNNCKGRVNIKYYIVPSYKKTGAAKSNKDRCVDDKLKKMALRVIAESLSEEEIAGLKEAIPCDGHQQQQLVNDELRKKTYIVHMAKAQMPAAFAEHSRWYDASLRSVSDTAEVLYTYDTVAHGFCARLTPAEARALEDLPGVLAVHPEVRYELHTTRTPEFLHLDRTDALIPQSNTESDVIVGVLDTGVWPESRSYDDAGLGPVPASWRGECVEAKDFTAAACNRKLVGAQFFSKGGKPLSSSPYPFIYAGNATNATNGNLCMQGTLLPDKIQAVSRQRNVTCDSKTIYSVSDLNYPSFSVAFETASGAGGGGSSKTTTVKHKRTLTNVGAPGTYKATVSAPEEVSVEVYPQELSFASSGERKSYTVSFSAASQPSGSAAFGRLVWSDGQHVVACPLAFTWT
ncbi:hypothetical protein ZIOFF_001849 [Zingiber officinale]|uniref:Uncharacterized protein n=1 Tax=Zingiber officinale TaxID=94328 RepID=A0A8J5IKZ6_ZINOF|nr:hypothetical protein ZIOFF_001849 [Zingiber officinale]